MNIFRTEELSDDEKAELAEKQLDFSQGSAGAQEEATGEADVSGEQTETDGDNGQEAESDAHTEDGNGNDSTITFVDEEETPQQQFEKDPETGYLIDPTSGVLLDPNTGAPVDVTISNLE